MSDLSALIIFVALMALAFAGTSHLDQHGKYVSLMTAIVDRLER